MANHTDQVKCKVVVKESEPGRAFLVFETDSLRTNGNATISLEFRPDTNVEQARQIAAVFNEHVDSVIVSIKLPELTQSRPS